MFTDTHIEALAERAILIGVRTPDITETMAQDYLDELAFLALTAGADAIATFKQNLPTADARTYVGSGKLREIAQFVEEHEVPMAIVDDELTPAQQKNLEDALKCTVLDRTSLILDIFATRATTSYARTQVELAQYQYLLPRLTRLWSHLERQKGGIGMRGPGETQIETDRRIVLDRIALLKSRLKDIDRQMQTQRRARGKLVRVALVGYTNVGKSTLMNALTKTNVLAENRLFATLDTTVRKHTIRNIPMLLTDTVGFIRKLPTHLIESFKSTLDEVREADVLVHVVDIAHAAFEQQIDVVNRTIHELDEREKPTIMVFNKVDAFSFVPKDDDDLTPMERANYSLDDLRKTWMARCEHCVFVSAREKIGFEELREMLYTEVKKVHVQRFPYNDFLYSDEWEEE